MLFFLLVAVALADPRAVPIPPAKVGDVTPVPLQSWNRVVATEDPTVFSFAVSARAVLFHFESVSVSSPEDIEVCVADHCFANNRDVDDFWSRPVPTRGATEVMVRVRGTGSGSITERADLGGNGRGNNLRPTRSDLPLDCTTDPDDNLPANCTSPDTCRPLPAINPLGRPTASILYQSRRAYYVCTAWLVSQTGLMITNHHCISSQTSASTIEFYFGCEFPCPDRHNDNCDYGTQKCHNCDLTYPYDSGCYSVMSRRYSAYGATLLYANSVLDFAVIQLKSTANVPCVADPSCPLRLVPASYRITAGTKVFMFHHSDGRPKLLSYFDRTATSGRVELKQVAPSGCYSGDWTYNSDSVGGSSGSAVLLDPCAVGDSSCLYGGYVVALHHCGYTSCVGFGQSLGVPIADIVARLQTLGYSLDGEGRLVAPGSAGATTTALATTGPTVTTPPTGNCVTPNGVCASNAQCCSGRCKGGRCR